MKAFQYKKGKPEYNQEKYPYLENTSAKIHSLFFS